MKSPIETLRQTLEQRHQAGKNTLGCFVLANILAFNPLDIQEPANGIAAMFSAGFSLIYFLQWNDYVRETDQQKDNLINYIMDTPPLAD